MRVWSRPRLFDVVRWKGTPESWREILVAKGDRYVGAPSEVERMPTNHEIRIRQSDGSTYLRLPVGSWLVVPVVDGHRSDGYSDVEVLSPEEYSARFDVGAAGGR